MDMTASIIPKSDQLNADDLIAGPVTVTIESVSAGSAEQPVDVHLVEFPGRAFRPSKSMRRVLVAAYGPETDVYVGKRLTLYRDPTITFGRDEVGGIRISAMSGITSTLKIALTVKRGQRAPFVVEPLADAAPSVITDALEAVTAAGDDIDAVRAVWTDYADRLDNDGKRRLTEAMTAAKTRIEATP